MHDHTWTIKTKSGGGHLARNNKKKEKNHFYPEKTIQHLPISEPKGNSPPSV